MTATPAAVGVAAQAEDSDVEGVTVQIGLLGQRAPIHFGASTKLTDFSDFTLQIIRRSLPENIFCIVVHLMIN